MCETNYYLFRQRVVYCFTSCKSQTPNPRFSLLHSFTPTSRWHMLQLFPFCPSPSLSSSDVNSISLFLSLSHCVSTVSLGSKKAPPTSRNISNNFCVTRVKSTQFDSSRECSQETKLCFCCWCCSFRYWLVGASEYGVNLNNRYLLLCLRLAPFNRRHHPSPSLPPSRR